MIDIETARRYYADHDSAHGFDHVLRVLRLAERIGEREGADWRSCGRRRCCTTSAERRS